MRYFSHAQVSAVTKANNRVTPNERDGMVIRPLHPRNASGVSPEESTQSSRVFATEEAGPAERPSLFAGLLPGDYAGISSSARIREFARGELLCFEGESVDQVLMLISGLVKMTQVGFSGSEVIVGLRVPGDVLGAAGLMSTGRHGTRAQAFRLCRALTWDSRTFKGVIERFPVLHQNLIRILGQDLYELEERFREVATEKVGARVARQLTRLGEKIGRRTEGVIEVGISREELAQMTGTTLFTVSRLLSAWESAGVVRSRREAVSILDLSALRAISEER